MKKTINIIILVLFYGITNLSAQMVDRQLVLVEKVTGISCTTCPAAANAVHDMMAAGLKVAPINYHWLSFDKVFNNENAESRITYYFPKNPYEMGAPTAIFDGTTKNMNGGSSSISVYNKYLPDYEKAIAVKSPIYIDIVSVEKTSNTEWNVTVTVTKKELSFDVKSLTLQTVLTESNIPYRWGGGLETVEHVERNMYPNYNGVKVVFDADNKFTYTAVVKMDDGWKYYNCDIVAFVQDNGTKEVYQANQIKLSSNVLAVPTDIILTTDPCSMNLNVTWSDGEYSKAILLGYDIYKGKEKLNKDIVLGNNYTVSKCKAGNNCVSLVAVYDLGESSKSYEKCATIEYPAGVTNPTNTVNMNNVTLNWTKPVNTNDGEACSSSLVGYNVYRENEKINREVIKGTTYTDVVPKVGTYLYYVTAQYENSESYRSDVMMVNITTVSVEDVVLKNINVYPNPVSSASNYRLQIVNNGEAIKCVMTDVSGKVVLETTESNINMSKLKDGMYIVVIHTKNGNKTFKVIKNK